MPKSDAQSRVDWQMLRERVARANLVIADATSLSHDRLEDILRKRALELAARKPEQAVLRTELQLLIVRAATDTFGLPMSNLLMTGRAVGMSKVPAQTSGALRGSIWFRGDVWSVYALETLMHLSGNPVNDEGWLVYLRIAGRKLALFVTEIVGTRDANSNDIMAAEDLASTPNQLVAGVLDGHIQVVELAALLSHPDLSKGANQ